MVKQLFCLPGKRAKKSIFINIVGMSSQGPVNLMLRIICYL